MITNIAETIDKKSFPRTINGKNVPFDDRLDYVQDLFKRDGEVDNFYVDYCSDILHPANPDGMSKRGRNSFHESWYKAFLPCKNATDYLTACKGSTGDIVCYDDESLRRLYNDPCLRKVKKEDKDRRRKDYVPDDTDDEYEMKPRRHNVFNIGSMNIGGGDDADEEYTQEEILENMSYRSNRTKYSHSTEGHVLSLYARETILGKFSNETERQVALMVMAGETQDSIRRSLGLTKSKLDTILHKHMAKSYKSSTNPVEYTKMKLCRRCGLDKSLDLFGKDARKADGKQSICKQCDSNRKKYRK